MSIALGLGFAAMGRAELASDYGFAPSASASTNVAAWNAANAALVARGGGVLFVDIPGTYAVNQCLLFYAGVHYQGVPGVIIQQDTTIQDFVGRNASGFDGDADISIDSIIFDQGAHLGTQKWAGNTYQIAEGTVTSATATSITIPTDITSNPTHYYIFILSGTGAYQCRKVVARTGAGAYTVAGWAVVPDATSTYRICVPKTRVTKTTTINGVGFTTQGTANSDFASGLSTGQNVWSGPMLFLNCKRLKITNCWIRDCAGNSIKLSGCSDYVVENVTLDNVLWCPGINQDGVHIEGGSQSPFGATCGYERATLTRGARNGVVRNIRTNTAFGRGVTDNTFAIVACDYLSQNWQGGEVDGVMVENVVNHMAMETSCRNIGQRQHRGQDCGLKNISYNGIYGKQSWLPKYGLPTASGDGYCQITAVNSQTEFVVNANGANQFPGGVIAVNEYVYISGLEKWVKVSGVSGTTITVASYPDVYEVGMYVAKIAKTVQAYDLISDNNDGAIDVPDHGTTFTTVSAGGGATVTTITLASAINNGRTLQVGDWIYNATRAGGLVQLTAVNTGTGVIAWSGNQNYQNGDTVNLCITYGILAGTKATNFTVRNAFFNTPVSLATISPNTPTTNLNYANVSGFSMVGGHSEWLMRSGALISIAGTCQDLSFSNLTSNNALTTRAMFDFASGSVIKSVAIDKCYYKKTVGSSGGFIGQNQSTLAKIDTIKITDCDIIAPSLDWLLDVPLIGSDGSGTCQVFVDNCRLNLYGIYSPRATGIKTNISVTNSVLQMSDRWLDAGTALGSGDLITLNLGRNLTLAGTVGQSRWTASASLTNLAGATTVINWGKPDGVTTFSADLDMHTDSNRVAGDYVYTGTGGHTLTLPQVARLKGSRFSVKNRGSGAAITISKASADGSIVYDTSAVASITIAAGANRDFVCDGTYWVAL